MNQFIHSLLLLRFTASIWKICVHVKACIVFCHCTHPLWAKKFGCEILQWHIIVFRAFWVQRHGLCGKGDPGSQVVNFQERCGGSGRIVCCGSWALGWLGLELGSRWPRSQSQASAVRMSAGRLPTLIRSSQREQHADDWHCPNNWVPQLLAEHIFSAYVKDDICPGGGRLHPGRKKLLF